MTGYLAGITKSDRIPFKAAERNCREFDRYCNSLPTIADGIMLKVWKGGLQVGHPKMPPPGRTLLARADAARGGPVSGLPWRGVPVRTVLS